jgi:hypothetical protein
VEDKDNTETNLAKQKLSKLDEILDELLKSYGISPLTSANSDVTQLLSLSRLEVNKMTAEECSEASYMLRSFAFNLQKEYNREIARVHWANEQIDKVVCKEIEQFDKYAKYDQKRALAIANNSYAYRLNEISIYASARARRIESLADKASDIARAFNDISMSRRKVY